MSSSSTLSLSTSTRKQPNDREEAFLNNAPKAYTPFSYEKLQTVVLEDEKVQIKARLQDLRDKAIEQVGPENVVQIIIYNATSNVLAGAVMMEGGHPFIVADAEGRALGQYLRSKGHIRYGDATSDQTNLRPMDFLEQPCRMWYYNDPLDDVHELLNGGP
eukprot:Gb_40448 [translate_table: standard]